MLALILKINVGVVTLWYEYCKNVLIWLWGFYAIFAHGKTECIIRSWARGPAISLEEPGFSLLWEAPSTVGITQHSINICKLGCTVFLICALIFLFFSPFSPNPFFLQVFFRSPGRQVMGRTASGLHHEAWVCFCSAQGPGLPEHSASDCPSPRSPQLLGDRTSGLVLGLLLPFTWLASPLAPPPSQHCLPQRSPRPTWPGHLRVCWEECIAEAFHPPPWFCSLNQGLWIHMDSWDLFLEKDTLLLTPSPHFPHLNASSAALSFPSASLVNFLLVRPIWGCLVHFPLSSPSQYLWVCLLPLVCSLSPGLSPLPFSLHCKGVLFFEGYFLAVWSSGLCARHWGYRDTGKRNPHADRKGEPQNALRAKGPSRAFQNALGTQSGGPAEEALGFSLKVRVDMMKRPQILLGH